MKKIIILLFAGLLLGGCSLTDNKTDNIQGNINNTGDNTSKSNETQTCKIDNLNDCADGKNAE